MTQTIIRSKSLGTKITESEYRELEALAAERNLTMSEWVRKVLLEQLKTDERARTTVADQTVLAEVVALRTILLNLFYRQANGELVTAEEMRQVIERADRDKAAKAQARLDEATHQADPRPPERAEAVAPNPIKAGAGAA